MAAPTPGQEEALRTELRRARERLDGLVEDLHELDRQLDGLSEEQPSYRLLEEVCENLEELREQGKANLFWSASTNAADDHLSEVRRRVDGFQKQLDETRSRRAELVEAIEAQTEAAEAVAGDVLDARWHEEQRRLEWTLEREVGHLPGRPAVMPWTRGGEDDRRLRTSLLTALLMSLLLGLLLPMVELPVAEVWEPVEVPERLARLIQEQRPPPPAPVDPAPTEELAATEEVVEPVPQPEPDTRAKGILAFREQFSSLAASVPSARLGALASVSNDGAQGSARPERNMVTTRAAGSSGGINLASLSRDVGNGNGEGIGSVNVALVTSSIGGTGQSDRPLSSGPGPSRTDEEIQIVFDRHKAALYRLYNRELRRNPTLQGQMVLRLTIEPDGSVSLCELQSTDMKAPRLSTQVVERVRTFDFGAKEGVPPVTIVYPIDFLPAA